MEDGREVTVDVERCLRAMKDVRVEGVPLTATRRQVIEEAIAEIQEDGEKALRANPLGVKNYASFGDQRFDLSGTPKHGHIVFRVARRSDAELGEDHVYLLECVRDVAPMTVPRDGGRRQPKKLNLCAILSWLKKLEEDLDEVHQHLLANPVTTHTDPNGGTDR